MNTFEITIQRKADKGWPVVVEQNEAGRFLAVRTEGLLELTDEALEFLNSTVDPREYGELLGDYLFYGPVRDAFVRARAVSPDLLTVLLSIEAPDLRALQWEHLCAPIETDALDYLALHTRTPFSIYLPSSTDRLFRAIGQRDLRALILVANPTGENTWGVDPFDAEPIVESVRQALGNIPSDVLGHVAGAIGPPTLQALINCLTKEYYSLLHIVAHGRVISKTTRPAPQRPRPGQQPTAEAESHIETVLYLIDEDHEIQAVAATALITELKRTGSGKGLPHFTFLATCESASRRAEAEGSLGGLAQRLVRELGMPAVLAMTDKVSIETAGILAVNFYAQLRAHGYVDRALAEACRSLIGRPDVTVPGLYSRLGGRPLFGDSEDRQLTPGEIEFGLSELEELLPERAPILHDSYGEMAARLRDWLGTDRTKLSKDGKEEYDIALSRVNAVSEEVLDISFRALALGAPPPRYNKECPFPGLKPFQTEEQRFFFGRQALVADLLKSLEQKSFLALLGASGSGKSSVALAGLVPGLQQLESNLQVYYMTPGNDPTAALHHALLTPLTVPIPDEQDPAIAGASDPDSPTSLLIVDQFEELFTLCNDMDCRTEFLDHLLTLARVGVAPAKAADSKERQEENLRVVITMRADFLGECAPYPDLRQAIQIHMVLIAPMDAAELRSAMEQQAGSVGLRFEADLSNTILDAVIDEPGAMPLLQHLLREMWKRRHGRWLLISEYRALGGIQQAIAYTADELHAQALPEEQLYLREIFTRLTRLGDATGPNQDFRDTRRRVTRAELILAPEDRQLVRTLLNRLADARLVVTSLARQTGGKELTDQELMEVDDDRVEVEVAHEALIRHWATLRAWLKEDRDILLVRREINKAAQNWKVAWAKAEKDGEDEVLASIREERLIHRGRRLDEIEDWRQSGRLRLNPDEDRYVDACLTYQSDQVRRAQERAAELERLLVESERQAKIALTRQLAALASSTKHDDELATLLAIEAYLLNQEINAGVQWLIDSALRELISRPFYSIIKTIKGWGRSVEFSPDAKYVAAGSHEAVWLWEWGNPNAEPQTLIVDEYEIHTVTFSPDGQQMASGNAIGVIRLWDLNDLTAQPQMLHDHTSTVTSMIFSPDGNYLLSGSRDTTARVWDMRRTPPTSWQLDGGDSFVMDARFSPDGKTLAVAGQSLLLWDLNELEAGPRTPAGHGADVRAVAFSRDGKILAAGGGDRVIRLWDTGRLENDPQLLDGHEISVLSLNFSVSGEHLISGGADRIMKIWDMRDLSRQPETLTGHTAEVNAVTASPNGAVIASTGNDSTVRLWNLSKPTEPMILPGSGDWLFSGVFSPNGRWLATGGRDNILVWDMDSPTSEPRKLSGHTGWVYCVRFSPDGQYLASSGDDHTVRLWSLDDPKAAPQLVGRHEAPVGCVAFSPNGHQLASGSHDELICIWDLAGSLPVSDPVILKDHKLHVESIAFTLDGKRLASCGSDNIVRLWDLATGTVVKKLLGQTGWIHQVVFTHDGRYLATPAGDRTVWLRDMNDLDADALIFGGHRHEVNAVAISSDGANLATACRDGIVRLWDLSDPGATARELTGHTGAVESVAFSPDNRTLVSSSIDGTVRLWTVSLSNLVEMGCRKVRRDLTPAEWKLYMPPNRSYQPTCAAVQNIDPHSH